MKRKPMSLNVLLNGIKTVLSLIFPLITFPYITRTLGPEGIGKANFSNSIASYFILLGSLGIVTYSIREGAKKCDNKEKLECFASEIWTLSILASAVAYVCLFVTMLLCNGLRGYRILIMMYSLQITFNALSMEWVLNIYEEYTYVTVRSFILQVLSLVLLFLLVRKPTDVYMYVLVQLFSMAGVAISNHIYVRRKIKFRMVWSKEMIRHLPSIMLIFSTTLATAIYVNLDTSMLGILCGDEQVGYYTVAAKLYNIIKALINSMVTVYAVRLCGQYCQNRKEYFETFNEAFQIIVLLTIPIAIGGYLLRTEIILVLGGEEYLAAAASMALLLFSIIPATLGNLYGSGALLVINQEKNMLMATSIGTIANVILNYFLIYWLKCSGAALATLITECLVCSILVLRAHHYIRLKTSGKHLLKVIMSSMAFVPIIWGIKHLEMSFWIKLILEIVICAFAYVGILYALHDELIWELVDKLTRRRHR